MGWADLTIFVGIFVIFAGIVPLVRQIRRRLRDRMRGVNRLDGIADIVSQTVCFGGVWLVQFGSIAQHVGDKTPSPHPWLTLYSTVATVLPVGIQLGRLYMRWQLHCLRATLDTESGEITPRA